MINRIELRKLRNGEYSQLIQDILSIILQNNLVTMQEEAQYNALVAVEAEIEAIFKVPTGSNITAELEKLDMLRDNAIRGIVNLVKGYTYSDDAGEKSHAIVLETHLNLFGNTAEDNYQSETSSIRNIINDWDAKPELTAAIAALNLDRWKTSLQNANNSFSDKYLQRAVELGSNTSENIKAKRLQANEAYYKLRDNIDARFTISEGAEPYQTVVASINGLITFYNDLLARRGGGGGNGGEAPTA